MTVRPPDPACGPEGPAAPGRPIALVGLRCSGKTSVGRALAAVLGRTFVDLDRELAARTGEEAGRLLARIGAAAFRALEEERLADVLARAQPLVLATGGGVVERAASRRLLRERATTVWLAVAPAVLAARLRADPAPRPPLLGADAAEELAALLERRAPLYAEVAALWIDCGERTVAEIVAELRARLGG